MAISILHISDLHMSRNKLGDIKKVTTKLFEDVKRIQIEEKIKIDFIIFSGDLVNKAENFKEEYDLALKSLINPLQDELGKNINDIFIVPGNHDVDRKKTSKNFEDGLNANLKSIDSFNAFFDSFGENKGEEAFLKRKLDGYRAFKSNKMKNNNLLESNFFFDVYKIQLQKIKIGIIGLNSVWRSSGFGLDEKRLLIGSRVLEHATEFIRDCDLKLAITHHPFSMLTDWDQKSLKNTMAQTINILFTGHMHDSDFSYEKPLLGKLYVSTAGAIFQGRIINGYSLLKLDLAQKTLTVFLRRWYDKRGEFDKEIEKCSEGKVVYENFELDNKDTNQLIEICNIKDELLKTSSGDSHLLIPIEDLSVKLNDVFVEPILSDESSYEKSSISGKLFTLKEILARKRNLFFYGRKEFGKTSLLSYIGDHILRNETTYEDKIPVYINFSELPTNNYRTISRTILNKMNRNCTLDKVDALLTSGNYVIMIDDYDATDIQNRDKRIECLKEFISIYPKCLFFFTVNETLSLFYNNIYSGFISELNADLFYLLSFNASKIRELLKKWNNYKRFNLNEMLSNIMYFFQQLQVPVTPMNVTLFIGVLFRDKNKKNIKNEAYLIENYLETILEKIQDSKEESEFDFREKESFLSHIAFGMVEKNKFEWSKNDFDHECREYFDYLDEEFPAESFFEDFFRKGIFQRVDGIISFKFRFWFSFFLAKSMQNSIKNKDFLLGSKYYLKYSTAFAYKAGLDRNDLELLNEVKRRLDISIASISKNISSKNFNEYEIEGTLIEYSKDIENEIKVKNNPAEVDKLRDKKYLNYNDEEQTIAPENEDYEFDLFELITLYSNIIRNTREISAEEKKAHLSTSVGSYQALMWESLELFKMFIESLDADEIKKFILKNNFTLKKNIEINEKELNKISKRLKEYIITVIPISIILYMTDHLSNNKFSRTIESLINGESNINTLLFYDLLLLKINFKRSITLLKNIIKSSDSYIIDGIVFECLINHCLENEVTEKEFSDIVEVLQTIREKYSRKIRGKETYGKDTFISDIQAKMNLIKFKRS